jgi:hypothetical protein
MPGLAPGIDDFAESEDVDGRDKPDHDAGAARNPIPLMPAKAGIQCFAKNWVPAFARTSGRSYPALSCHCG